MVLTLVVWLVVTTAGFAVLAVVLSHAHGDDGPRDVEHRWLHSLRREHFEPVGPPIEEIAATLRRLRGWLAIYDDPTPIPGKATKVAATSLAYDRVLVDACRALRITQALGDTVGFDHEAERLRVESALEEAGLVLRPRPRRRTGS